MKIFYKKIHCPDAKALEFDVLRYEEYYGKMSDRAMIPKLVRLDREVISFEHVDCSLSLQSLIDLSVSRDHLDERLVEALALIKNYLVCSIDRKAKHFDFVPHNIFYSEGLVIIDAFPPEFSYNRHKWYMSWHDAYIIRFSIVASLPFSKLFRSRKIVGQILSYLDLSQIDLNFSNYRDFVAFYRYSIDYCKLKLLTKQSRSIVKLPFIFILVKLL